MQSNQAKIMRWGKINMVRRTAAQAIVDVMLQEGVEKAFCVPGESYLSLLDALNDQGQIQLISGRHEGGVSFMAEGYAKASGKVGVCLATRGPGATNLSIGLHTAHQDSTPLVAFIGQVEHKFRDREGFQEVNFAEYFSHIVKWAVELREPGRAAEIVSRAFHIARTGRPGPVVVSLPQDVLTEIAEFDYKGSTVYSDSRPAEVALLEAKRLLETAKKPAIIAGGGVTARKAASDVVKLSEKYHVPVISAFRRFDAFPNHHENYIGSLGLSTPGYLLETVKNADVILALGTRFSQITSQDYSLINEKAKLVHVDISPNEINKIYPADLGITADVKAFIQELAALEADVKNADERKAYISSTRSEYVKFIAIPEPKPSDYTDMNAVMKGLKEVLPEDAIITSDAGNFFGWLYRFYQFKAEGTYVGPTAGAMGYGLPSALGAKIAHPDRTVLSLSGDGGFMMTMQELETAVRYNIPVIAIVVNNNMYGTIRMHQEREYPERVIGTELSNPNFIQFVQSMGGYGELVENNEAFLPAIERAIESKKPAVIEVRTNPQQISVVKTIDELRGLVKN